MRRLIAFLVFVVLVSSVVVGQDLAMELGVSPVVSVPTFSSSGNFSVGYGANLRGGAQFAALPLFFGGSVGYTLHPTPAQTALSLVSLGAGGGLSLTPSILDIRLGAYLGGYLALYEDQSGFNPFASAGLSVSFNLGGGLSLGLGAEYSYFLTMSGGAATALYQGIDAFVGVSLSPGRMGGGTRQPQIRLQPPTFDRVFPVFYRYYTNNDFGSLVVENGERGTIENLKVSFFVNEYMDFPSQTTIAEELGAGDSLEVPLTALWNSSVLGLTESTNVAAQIEVSYNYQGEPLATTQAFDLRIENRNVMTWSDDRRAAAFVTTRDPSVLRFSRNVTAMVGQSGDNALSEQLRKALAIFGAMDLYGFEYVTDSTTPYEKLSEQEDTLDYLQFPVQTLDYHTGDCDDLAILYSALLESVDVRTAFVTVPGHIYVAFALDMEEDLARKTFARADDLIIRDGEAWLPVEVTVVDQGFVEAWAIGAEQWRLADQDGRAGFFPLAQAWTIYEATGFTDDSFRPALPPSELIIAQYERQLGQLIQREIGPLIADLNQKIASASGTAKARLQNRLGTVYARYGMYEEASDHFLSASLSGYGKASFNLGNISFLEGDIETAFGYYQQALRDLPNDATVLISLAKAQFEREQYESAAEYYQLGKAQDPEAAEEFAYIVGETGDAGRAASAAKRGNVLWGDD